MLWKIQEDQSYYQKIYTFLSGSFCTSLSSKKQVRELSRQDLREISDIPKKIDIRRSDVRPEAYWTSFQTKRTQNICMISCIPTRWNQLSPPTSMDLRQRLVSNDMYPLSWTHKSKY